MSKKVIEITF